jgi:glycosyltransferase involved in cell wall biosynthesis
VKVKKNVLQLLGSFHQGGSERQALQLTRLLREDGAHNIFLAALNRQGVLLEEAENMGFADIPEFPLTSFHDLNFVRQMRKLVRFLGENKIDIVHTHDFYTNVFGIAAARIAKVKVKIASKRETGGMRSKSQKLIENRIFKTADLIAVNSKAVERYLLDLKISAGKINVIYNGLDLERLKPKLSNRGEICEELNLPPDGNAKFITLVANLRHEVKNQPMFLRVAQRVAAKFPEAIFVLAGEGELKESLEQLSKELQIAENVRFLGGCAKIPELLSVSFAGVLTSFHEGFSNSILEYMAANLPVVATDVGGAGEAVAAGKTGFLVDSDDDKSMANRLIELLENPEKAERFGKSAGKIVEEKFSCKAQLENTLKLYRRALHEK